MGSKISKAKKICEVNRTTKVTTTGSLGDKNVNIAWARDKNYDPNCVKDMLKK